MPDDTPLILDRFQREAIEHLEAGRSVLVSAPTGTGKTLIADRAIEAVLRRGDQAIFTAPIKALSNQKFRDYGRLLGEERVGLLTGDLVIRREAPLRIMTTEILRNMLLLGEPLDDLALVVVDEIHFLDDAERGTVWEELLIYLPDRVQLLGLSATLSNIDEFVAWLRSIRTTDVALVREDQRAVPLAVELTNRDAPVCGARQFEHHWRAWSGEAQRRSREGRQRGRRGARWHARRRRKQRDGKELQTKHHEVVARLEDGLLPCLYFVYSRVLTEAFARELARRRPDGMLPGELRDEVDAELEAFDREHPDVLQPPVANLLWRGIAFHHAGMHVLLKGLVERLYERRLVRVLYCTSTFALGINMPARTVVFHEVHKYDGRKIVPLTVRDFMQMAGRAGRRGIDERGHVVIREDFADYRGDRRLIAALLEGRHEPVSSAFNLSFNSVVNLLEHHRPDELRELLQRSFLAFQLARQPARTRAGRRGKRRRRGAGPDQVWLAFQRKRALLQHIGYLAEDGTFQAGARVLQYVQIEEIVVTELVLSGILEGLDAPETFGVLCVFSGELPRRVRVPRPDKRSRRLLRQLERLRYADPVVRAEGEQGAPATFGPELFVVGAAWFDGDLLLDLADEIDAPADITGSLVAIFRRATDLAGQLREVYEAAEDEVMVDRLRTIVRTVRRDEVEVVG